MIMIRTRPVTTGILLRVCSLISSLVLIIMITRVGASSSQKRPACNPCSVARRDPHAERSAWHPAPQAKSSHVAHLGAHVGHVVQLGDVLGPHPHVVLHLTAAPTHAAMIWSVQLGHLGHTIEAPWTPTALTGAGNWRARRLDQRWRTCGRSQGRRHHAHRRTDGDSK